MQSGPGLRVDRKPRRSREQWQAIIRDYEASGRSSGEYCQEHGLTPSVFANWNRVFRSGGGNGNSPFIELPSPLAHVLNPDPPDKGWRVELELGEGVVLRLR